MEENIKQMHGDWDLGYSLDKHTISSTPIGPNEWGHMQFATTRSEAGEALYQLKYCFDFSQVGGIALQMFNSLSQYFSSANLIIPMPASKHRPRQPVAEIAQELSRLMNIPCYVGLLVKKITTPPMKDIPDRDERVQTLIDAFDINGELNDGLYDVLIVDDLYDTGSSLEAATKVLRQYGKFQNIYVATVTRKK